MSGARDPSHGSQPTVGAAAAPTPTPGGARAYLLVVEGGSSRIVHLPAAGAVVVGRAPEALVRLHHPSVSRQHARLELAPGGMRVSDLGSHNGTRVNGQLVDGARALSSGDVITTGDVVLVLHAETGLPGARSLVAAPEWRRRLAEEVDRAQVYQRPFAVVAVARVEPAEQAAALAALAPVLRLIDVAGRADDELLLLLLPELARDDARALAARALAALAAPFPAAGAGCATSPADGCDAETLLLACRTAARAAAPGKLVAPGETAQRLELGERSVLVAHPLTARVFALIERLAASDLPVLVLGETGAGKENAAWAVHHGSPRRGRPFLTVNCAAIPDSLVESELFGHEKGAFTGATAAKAGLFEAASGGTLFLDEVGELPLPAQAKLLRALDAHVITRVGDVRERPVDVRIVAATNRDPEKEVEAGRMRPDLFFRLSGATVIVPPLRDRKSEIPVLAREFLAQACQRAGRAPLELSPGAMRVLLTWAWPGNVRELRNVMDYVAATVLDDTVEPYDLPERMAGPDPPLPEPFAPAPGPAAAADPAGAAFRPVADELRELEKRRMSEALAAAGGVKTRAAQLIGMPIRTFTLKLKQYGL